MNPQMLYQNFRNPSLVLLGILLFGIFSVLQLSVPALVSILLAIILGTYGLIRETISSLLKKQFALDYIALLAVIVALITGEYLVGAIIALMISTGETLESYGASQAKKSLTNLVNRIPQQVILLEKNKHIPRPISTVKVGQSIFVRKGEVVPLDGTLVSKAGMTDESSLTGEPYFIEKFAGDIIRSGTVNMGEAITITVTKAEKDSTYRKIVAMVQDAQSEKAPLIRLADRYSTIFTLITLAISGFAYFNLGGMNGVLVVLVVATPCPLIIATPIALLGGMNAAAKKRIIIKRLSVLETLQHITTIVFDKTGTLTLGKPQIDEVITPPKGLSVKEALSIAAALERNSLHPLAKAIIEYAATQKAPHLSATSTEELLGKGITGTVAGKKYTLEKIEDREDVRMKIALKHGGKTLAIISFSDILKKDSLPGIKRLLKNNYELHVFTGDREASAKQALAQIGEGVLLTSEMKPEDKQRGIARLKSEGKKVAMIGDGINDAPALALADVGMVFSSDEQTAASEAADIVLLGGDFALASETFVIAKKTVDIALQSIKWGIGLSITCMIFASFGLIPPLVGAGIQEVIDVAVILNALRASRQ